MRKLNRREAVLLGLLAVGAAVLAIRWLHGSDAPVPTVGRSTASRPEVPRIDLARVDRPQEPAPAGRRNIFGFGTLARSEEDVAPIEMQPAQPPVLLPPVNANTAPETPPVPSLPPLNLKFMGSVETAAGKKVAILITDRKEVLNGQAGEVIANRYRVTRIGLESVDLEDVNTGQPQRIPLRAN